MRNSKGCLEFGDLYTIFIGEGEGEKGIYEKTNDFWKDK